MKTKYFALIAILGVFSLAACNTENSNPSNIYGTWKVDGPQHATWIGGANSNHIPATVTRIYRSATASGDSTVVDSSVTMTYPNANFSAVMIPAVEHGDQANISLRIKDSQIPIIKKLTIHLDTTQSTLGSSFIQYFKAAAGRLPNGGYQISPTYKFDCSQTIQPSQGNLRYIVKAWPTDSTYEIFKYNLQLKGVQQAAQHVACQ